MKPFITDEYDIEEYHALGDIKKYGDDAILSKSQLAEMECPAKFKYKYIDGGKDDEKDYLNVGNAVHTLALEPDLFHDRFYILPEGMRRDKRMKAYQDEIEAAGKRKMITHNDFQDIEGMAKSLSSNRTALSLLDTSGKIEPSIFWNDEETGVKLRCRPDFYRDDGLVVDLKTCNSAEPMKFFRDAFNFHYDMSVGMTCDGIKMLTGKMPDNYVFLVIEKKPPYIIEAYDSFRPWDKEDITKFTYYDAGQYRFRKMLEKFVECKKSGHWHGYQNKITPMSVPAYEMRNMED